VETKSDPVTPDIKLLEHGAKILRVFTIHYTATCHSVAVGKNKDILSLCLTKYHTIKINPLLH